MNKEMMKKVVATKVVDMAVKASKTPNQYGLSGHECTWLFGKPKAKFDLTLDDYNKLADFMKQ